MATRRLNEPIEPMTLCNMRANGVRSLAIPCRICHYAGGAMADHVPVPAFGPRMVCTRCGIIGADARPNWKVQLTRERPTGISSDASPFAPRRCPR
jgi:hypothetical protein